MRGWGVKSIGQRFNQVRTSLDKLHPAQLWKSQTKRLSEESTERARQFRICVAGRSERITQQEPLMWIWSKVWMADVRSLYGLPGTVKS